jgi:hypothetical protein
MKTVPFRALLLVVPALFALAGAGVASAQEAESQGGQQDVEKVVWTVVGVAITALVLGILYLFKRRIGAFPRNPSWVAPISVMPAGELPDEADAGHEAAGHVSAH